MSPQRHPLQALKFLGWRPRAACESFRAIPGPFPSFAFLTLALEAPQWLPQPTLQAPVLQPSPVVTSLCRCQASSVPGGSGAPSLGGLPGAPTAPTALVTSGCGVHVWASPPSPPTTALWDPKSQGSDPVTSSPQHLLDKRPPAGAHLDVAGRQESRWVSGRHIHSHQDASS